MRVAILESIVMLAGYEVEFDRILAEELKKQGHVAGFYQGAVYRAGCFESARGNGNAGR